MDEIINVAYKMLALVNKSLDTERDQSTAIALLEEFHSYQRATGIIQLVESHISPKDEEI